MLSLTQNPMSLYESLVRPAAFLMDPEQVHEAAMRLIQRGIFRSRNYHDLGLEQTLFGVQFTNPIGLAAGFDKNAVALNYWHQLGFGFVECGTITWHAQPGNPRPRLFRVPENRALINRMGFNNDGAVRVGTRIAASRSRIPVGINLGKSKITDLKDAAEDYRESFRTLHRFGSYFVINVSSPNTLGLRDLQDRGPLLEIIFAMREVDDAKPLFVKVAPDLEVSALDDVIEVANSTKLTGIIATNTTISREGLSMDPDQSGGLSGAPLRDRSNDVLRYLYQNSPRDTVLIGVGGIETGADAYQKICLGAHLTQLYTGWIYGGPQMIPSALEEMARLMRQDGFESIAQARGSRA